LPSEMLVRVRTANRERERVRVENAFSHWHCRIERGKSFVQPLRPDTIDFAQGTNVRRMYKARIIVVVSLLVAGASGSLSAEGVYLSEFMVVNQTTLRDEDGEWSDWLEIYNGRNTAVNLSGWFLTDDPTEPHKWRFPEIEIGAGRFVVVLASQKDRRDPASELHTNFSLTDTGEFLALVGPGSTLESFYGPKYPAQHADISLGLAMETSSARLLRAESTARYHVPTSDTLGRSWTETDFDDGAWLTGSAAIGYDRKDKPTLDGLIQTDVDEISGGVNAAIYARIPFAIGTPASVELQMRYADGFVAYVNGVEVAR